MCDCRFTSRGNHPRGQWNDHQSQTLLPFVHEHKWVHHVSISQLLSHASPSRRLTFLIAHLFLYIFAPWKINKKKTSVCTVGWRFLVFSCSALLVIYCCRLCLIDLLILVASLFPFWLSSFTPPFRRAWLNLLWDTSHTAYQPFCLTPLSFILLLGFVYTKSQTIRSCCFGWNVT